MVFNENCVLLNITITTFYYILTSTILLHTNLTTIIPFLSMITDAFLLTLLILITTILGRQFPQFQSRGLAMARHIHW